MRLLPSRTRRLLLPPIPTAHLLQKLRMRSVTQQTRRCSHDLSPAFPRLSPHRCLQLRRWLCRDATDPGGGREPLSLDQHGGLHRSRHDFPDDARPDRNQRRDLHRTPDGGPARCRRGDPRGCSTELRRRHDHRHHLHKVPETEPPAGRPENAPPGGRRPHLHRRAPDPPAGCAG